MDIVFIPRIGAKGSLVIESKSGFVEARRLEHVKFGQIVWQTIPVAGSVAQKYRESIHPGFGDPDFRIEWETLRDVGVVIGLLFFSSYFAIFVRSRKPVSSNQPDAIRSKDSTKENHSLG